MFEHFELKVASNDTHNYYINTLGFAFSQDKQTGAQYLLNVRYDNFVKINKTWQNLPKLIYKTVYYKSKIHKIVFLDGKNKNLNIENLANLKTVINQNDIIIKDNLTGKCKKVTQTQFLQAVKKLEQFKVECYQQKLKLGYLIKSQAYTILNATPHFETQIARVENLQNFNVA